MTVTSYITLLLQMSKNEKFATLQIPSIQLIRVSVSMLIFIKVVCSFRKGEQTEALVTACVTEKKNDTGCLNGAHEFEV